MGTAKPLSRYVIHWLKLTVGILSALVAWHFGPSWTALAGLLLTWCLVPLTMIDFDHQLLPDDITIPLLWVGLLINATGLFVPLDQAVWGAALGYMTFWSIFWIFKLLTGKDGMGYGDFKLLAALGAWFGMQALPTIILLSSFVGAVIGISLVLFRGRDRQIPISFWALSRRCWLAISTVGRKDCRFLFPTDWLISPPASPYPSNSTESVYNSDLN